MLKQLASHHVCDTSQLLHLLPRQKAGIKAEAVAATSVRGGVCNLFGEMGSLTLVHKKIFILYNSCYISKLNIYDHS